MRPRLITPAVPMALPAEFRHLRRGGVMCAERVLHHFDEAVAGQPRERHGPRGRNRGLVGSAVMPFWGEVITTDTVPLHTGGNDEGRLTGDPQVLSSTSALAAPVFTCSIAFSQSALALYPSLDVAMTWPFVALSRQRNSFLLSS